MDFAYSDKVEGLRLRLAAFMDLADHGDGVIAQLLFGRGRQMRPGAVSIDAVDETSQSIIDVAGLDQVGDCRGPSCDRGRWRRCERGIEIAAGLGEHQPAQQVRPLLRDTEGDVSAT